MIGDLGGAAALVTGGSRGIGAAIVTALCDAGAGVVFTASAPSREAERLAAECRERFGVRCELLVADQSDASGAGAAVQRAAGLLGSLGIVVANAGVSVWWPLTDRPVPEAELERQLAVNLVGTTAVVRAAARTLPRDGRIIVIGSTAALQVGMRGLADYAAGKAALAGFVRGAAWDLAPRGITVNLVQPGHVETRLNPGTRESHERVRTRTALGRFGRPEEIAAGVVFLASPSASYITGASLNIDGGATA
jgi:NAD(P)-dependent dehydrogenase (short-subunit alcohol dehydrogenase family)